MRLWLPTERSHLDHDVPFFLRCVAEAALGACGFGWQSVLTANGVASRQEELVQEAAKEL